LIVITGIILVSFFTSTEILAQNSVTSQYGGLNTDQDVYSLERHEIAHVKISGVGPNTNVRERVSIIITLPDSTKSNHSVFSTKDGYFELILPIPYESLGNYKVFASMSGKILGDIYFSVEEKTKENINQSSPHTLTSPNIPSQNTSSLITIRTDSPSYESGDTIYISGTVTSYDPSNSNNQMQVSIQIINSINNIVTISQISPNSDNTYSISVKGAGPMWKFAGEYTVRANFFQQNAFTTFEFSIPSIPITPPSSPIQQPTSTFKTPSKIDTPPTAPKVDPAPSVSKGILKPTIPKDTIVKSTLNKTTPIDYSGIFSAIAFFAFIFLVVVLLPITVYRKFKKRTKNHNSQEEKRRKEHEWNKNQSEDHHRRQEEERQRWEREKYNRQQKEQKQHKGQKQYTESNKTEFTVTESLEILNVHHDATAAIIKKAQREMVMKYHPDKHKSLIQRKHAEIMMKNINIAYETLQRANRV